uniref:Uncharacterized protein n=1 Tax=Panagrolaimus sp. ES5 TaxID=591445 RepID=A0AC34FP83_9BILA
MMKNATVCAFYDDVAVAVEKCVIPVARNFQELFPTGTALDRVKKLAAKTANDLCDYLRYFIGLKGHASNYKTTGLYKKIYDAKIIKVKEEESRMQPSDIGTVIPKDSKNRDIFPRCEIKFKETLKLVANRQICLRDAISILNELKYLNPCLAANFILAAIDYEVKTDGKSVKQVVIDGIRTLNFEIIPGPLPFSALEHFREQKENEEKAKSESKSATHDPLKYLRHLSDTGDEQLSVLKSIHSRLPDSTKVRITGTYQRIYHQKIAEIRYPNVDIVLPYGKRNTSEEVVFYGEPNGIKNVQDVIDEMISQGGQLMINYNVSQTETDAKIIEVEDIEKNLEKLKVREQKRHETNIDPEVSASGQLLSDRVTEMSPSSVTSSRNIVQELSSQAVDSPKGVTKERKIVFRKVKFSQHQLDALGETSVYCGFMSNEFIRSPLCNMLDKLNLYFEPYDSKRPTEVFFMGVYEKATSKYNIHGILSSEGTAQKDFKLVMNSTSEAIIKEIIQFIKKEL